MVITSVIDFRVPGRWGIWWGRGGKMYSVCPWFRIKAFGINIVSFIDRD